MPVRTVPGVLTRSSPRAMPVVAVRPRPWSRARRWLRAAVTGFEPRATPAVRTSAAPGVRLDIDAGPHGPGRGHRVEPPGDAGGRGPAAVIVPSSPTVPGGGHQVRAPGRRQRSARRRGPGRAHQVEPPGDASGPHVGAVPGVLTRSSPRAMPVVAVRPRPWSRARRCKRARAQAVPAVRTSAAPAVRLAIDPSPHGPGPWSPGSSLPGRCRRSARRRGAGRSRGHRVRPRAMPAIRTPARSRPRPWSRARRCKRARAQAVPAVRTSAAPAVRLAIDPGPHGPGPWSPGRAPPGGGGGPELASDPGRGHQVRAPRGDAGDPHVGAALGMTPFSCIRAPVRRYPYRLPLPANGALRPGYGHCGAPDLSAQGGRVVREVTPLAISSAPRGKTYTALPYPDPAAPDDRPRQRESLAGVRLLRTCAAAARVKRTR